MGLDFLVVILSYLFAFLLRFEFMITPENIYYFNSIMMALPIIIAIQTLIFYFAGIMRSLWKYVGIQDAIRISLSVLIANALSFVLITLTGFIIIPRSIYIMAAILSMTGIIGVRGLYRYLQIQKNYVAKSDNAVIIGAGDAGYMLAREILSNDKYQTKIIGFVDDNKKKTGRAINGVRILGTCDDLATIYKKHEVTCAYLAIPSASKDEVKRILTICQELNLKVFIMGISEVDRHVKPVLRNVSIEDLLGRGEIQLQNNELETIIKGKTILVTGAGGSIGSELCRQILKFAPSKIICFDIYENGMYDLQQEVVIKQRKNEISNDIEMICLIGSVKDVNRLDEIMVEYKPSMVYHAAAHKHVPLVESSPKEAIKNNVMGTHNVVQACIRNKVDKMILISTDKAVNPTNVMGATKRLCELIIQANRNNGVTKLGAVRFGNVLGSNGSVIPLFTKQIENGGPVTVTDKEITRYFMTIPEATQLVLQASVYANMGDIFVLDMGKPVKIAKLAEDLIRLSGLKPGVDIEIEYVGLRPGEKMYEELSLGYEKRYKTANDLIFVNEAMDVNLALLNSKIEQLKQLVDSDNNIETVKKNIIEIIDIDKQ